jgi:hypothetical protein
MGQCHEIFDFWFFSWISFCQASDTWQMEKIFKQKNFNNLVWAPLGSRVNIYLNFCLQVHFKVSASWYCSHYLPPVSTTLWELVAIFTAGVVDTGGKFAAGVVDTGGNLPPVSTTPVVHLDLRISPRIFEKNSK